MPLNYSRFRSEFSQISPEAKEMNCFEGQRKNTEEKWNFKYRSAELSSSAFHEQESMKKLLVLFCLDFFFCQRQLCSFLVFRVYLVYVRSWTIISICSVTLHRVKSKWLSSLKSARKLRSEIQNRWCFDFLTKRFENVHKYLSKEMENFMHFTFTQRKSHNSDKLT